ncbi:uncharacterized protein ARMOST_22385 [Armillaria ostoyae]|uniref:Uncharacterized protein n=1 Tax=Armillaria ostoyae TaxID=47428 RepID=A0A284SCQ8_ARMOS|nr:uncharacterized protein ARMOST_22385 [Armillaria ostoyae]
MGKYTLRPQNNGPSPPSAPGTSIEPGSPQGEVLDDSLSPFTVYLSPLRPTWSSSRSAISAMGHQQKHRSLFLRLVYVRPVRHYIPSESLTLNVVLECARTTGTVLVVTLIRILEKPHAETGPVRDYEEICQTFLVCSNEHGLSAHCQPTQDGALAGDYPGALPGSRKRNSTGAKGSRSERRASQCMSPFIYPTAAMLHIAVLAKRSLLNQILTD